MARVTGLPIYKSDADLLHVGIGWRYSDATDGKLSWYPNAHFRYVVSYGTSKLDKNSVAGRANFWQFRAQFEL